MAKEIEEIGSVYQDTLPSTSAAKVVVDTGGVRKKRTMSWMEDVDEQDRTSGGNHKELLSSPSRKKSEDDSVADRRSLDERIKSPTSSISSKRTSNSGIDVLSTTLRTKIRQQEKSKLERKRGDVQLTKRLQRSQTHTIEEDASSDIDQDQLDAQIEHSLKLGSKFIANTDDSRLPPECVQYDFLTATYEEGTTIEEASSPMRGTSGMLFLAKSKPRPNTDEGEFQMLCTTYEKKRSSRVDIENGTQRTPINFFSSESAYDYSILKQRLNSDFIDPSGNILGSDLFFTDKPLKPEQDDDERPLCSYVKAEDWKVASKRLEQKEFAQLDIDINRLAFDHHWLFSKEDMICSVIRNLHATQTIRAKEALSLLRGLITEKELAQGSDPTDTSLQTSIEKRIAELISGLEEKQNNYIRLGQLIEENWHRLRLTRREQGFSSSTLTVQKSISMAQEDANVSFMNLSERLQEFTRIPVYSLTETNTISEQRPKEEMERLAFIQKCHIQLLIHFNDILVCKTKFRTIDANFIVTFGQIYNLQIHEIPQSIMITIIEKAPRIDARIIAKIGLPLPDEDKVTSTDAPLEAVEFGSDLLVQKTFSAVGSGGQSPCISGRLFCNVSWAQRGIRTYRCDDIRGLFKQQKQRRTDIFELIPKTVRLCSDEEFDSDLRLEVLKQRSEHKLAKSRTTQRIGLISAEIDPQILVTDEQKMKDQLHLNTGIDAHRIAGNQYAAMIRSQLLERVSSEQRAKSFHDVVHEEPIPTIFSAFGTLFGPADTSRKLKPMRRSIARQQVISGVDYRILVNVQSAMNLPERIHGGLQPFVQITFQGSTARTTVVSGRNPNWQQSIGIKLNRMREAENDFKVIVDSLQLNIYDQIVTKLDSDDREPNSVHEQLENHLIGYVLIPFSTVYCNAKIDGCLRVRTPLFFSSYRHSDKPSYIKVLIAIDPTIIPPRILSPSLTDSNESDQLIKHCIQWETESRSHFPERRFVSLVSDANGRRVLACRYIRAIKPPSQLQSQSIERMVETACRIISYVPFVSDPVMFPGVYDLWTTADQFLMIGCGDEEEHAILLCCWLLHVKVPAYLLLGSALPEGPKAAYVLALVGDKTMILNPSDGNCYSKEDPLCPLLSVGTVINGSNAYANIQSHDHPSQMHFDFKKSTQWRPLFEKDKDDMQSIQPEFIAYTDINEDVIVQFRSRLERDIKLRFDEARPYGIPQWNLFASRVLRELLADFESSSGNTPNVDLRLAQLRNSYNVSALAFRDCYVSAEHLIESVMRTNMHINSERTAQFALAAHIQPYMNNIVSCSVAIAALKPLINT